jgi:hypothetical protein
MIGQSGLSRQWTEEQVIDPHSRLLES